MLLHIYQPFCHFFCQNRLILIINIVWQRVVKHGLQLSLSLIIFCINILLHFGTNLGENYHIILFG